MSKINFLTETKEFIHRRGLFIKDIVFIGKFEAGETCSWEKFSELANFEYDNGYGGNIISLALIIEFQDGHRMTRGEYDGSEWWDIHVPFKMPKEPKPLTSVVEQWMR